MGLVMGLITVRDATIERILADPPLVWKILAPDDPEPYQEARAAYGAGAADHVELVEGEGEHLHLDKAWHGIHYLLTGTAWEGAAPLNLLLCGDEVGDIDVGYGQPRAVSAGTVAQAGQVLAALSDAAIRARFDPAAMMRADIYPGIWDRPPSQDDSLGYLMSYVAQLRVYLARAAADGMGVIVFVS
jgi:Domain of unknown function (DUF1877)